MDEEHRRIMGDVERNGWTRQNEIAMSYVRDMEHRLMEQQRTEENVVNQRLAENFGRAANIDPDDLLYSTVANSPRSMIERAIEANTDYDVVAKTRNTINLINRHGSESDYLNNDPVHEYDAGNKSIVEIIRELRDKSERNLFNKDFK